MTKAKKRAKRVYTNRHRITFTAPAAGFGTVKGVALLDGTGRVLRMTSNAPEGAKADPAPWTTAGPKHAPAPVIVRGAEEITVRLPKRYTDRLRQFALLNAKVPESDAVVVKRLIRWAERQFKPKGKRASLYAMRYVNQGPVEVACWLKDPKGVL
jgi:hypothetical protein